MVSTRKSTYSEVLVPLDERDRTLRSVPFARLLARRLETTITFFHVSEDVQRSQDRLRAVVDAAAGDMDVHLEVMPSDNPVEAIVARAGEDCLICMATAATLRPHQGHFGSVAEGVVRQLRRPVMLIGPSVDLDPDRANKVVVPVDGSELSEAVIDVGKELAVSLGLPMWIVSVVSPDHEARARAGIGVEYAAVESGYVRQVAESVGHTPKIDTLYEVLHRDDPAEAIVEFAGKDGLVVMSTHGRSGLNRIFAGSVATSVVSHSLMPVMVLRPSHG